MGATAVLSVGGEPVDGGVAVGVDGAVAGGVVGRGGGGLGASGDVGGLVWAGAAVHRSAQMRAVAVPLAGLLAYSLELPPVERVFLAVRRWVEGVVYGGDIEAQVRAVEGMLGELASSPERVRSLVGWDWLVEALEGVMEVDSERLLSTPYRLPRRKRYTYASTSATA